MKIKRKTLYSLLFDVGTMDHEAAIVTAYHYLEDDTMNINVRSGFISLNMYHKNIPLGKIKALNTKKKILEACKFAIDSVIPNYAGKKELSDFYYSPHLFAVHYSYGIINVENQETPKK